MRRLLAVLILAGLAVTGAVALAPLAQSQTGTPIIGWAWSETIGWVSLTCDHTSDGTAAPYNTNTCTTVDYSLTLNTNNTITGYAWSSNIGWVQFGGLSGFPT